MNKKSRFIGIMVAGRNRKKQILKQYLAYAGGKMKLYSFTPSAIDWKRKRIVGLQRRNGKWVTARLPFPRAVYNRCYDKNDRRIQRMEKAIGRNRIFNHINRFDKFKTHRYLSRSLAQHLPETVPYDHENAIRLLQNHKVTYVKPVYGYKGKGVYRVELKDSGEFHIGQHHFAPEIVVGSAQEFETRMKKLMGHAPHIIQQEIVMNRLDDQVFDLRALVQKNNTGEWSITNIVSRIAYAGCFNTSVCEKICSGEEALLRLYPPEWVASILHSVSGISLEAAQIMETRNRCHLGELSVDFALDPDGQVWIIEVNGKPQKDLYDGIRKMYRVYKRPIQYARYLSEHS